MGIRMKLRDYKAEVQEDPEERRLRKRAAIATIVCVALPVAVVVSVVGRGQASGTRPGAEVAMERVVLARAGSPNIVRSDSQDFVYSNWGHLLRSGKSPVPPPATRDADLGSPDWSGIEVYRELRGMAVYEVRERERGSAAPVPVPVRAPANDASETETETGTDTQTQTQTQTETEPDVVPGAARPRPELPVGAEEEGQT